MATGAVTAPPGYTLEQPQSPAPTPPPGYTLEGNAPLSAPAAATAPPEQPQGFWNATGIPALIHSAKQSWADSQSIRDQESQVAKNVTESVKKGDFGTAAEILLNHIGERGGQVVGKVYEGAKENLKANLTELDPAHGKMYAGPVMPMPGVGAAAGEFADEVTASAPAASAGATAASGPGLVKQVMQGKDVAQAPAQSAVRSSVGASAEEPLLQGDQTIIDKPLNDLEVSKKAAYAKMDQAAGFDVKAEETQLKNDLYNRQQLGNTPSDVSQRAKLDASIADSQQRLADAQAKMKDAGIDPQEAKTLNTQWKAGQDIKKIIVKNTSADGATVKVDSLLNDLKKAQFSKYGNRVEQFLGSDAGNKLMSDLMDAQKTGQSAMKAQDFAKMAAKYVGLPIAGAVAGAAVYGALK